MKTRSLVLDDYLKKKYNLMHFCLSAFKETLIFFLTYCSTGHSETMEYNYIGCKEYYCSINKFSYTLQTHLFL